MRVAPNLHVGSQVVEAYPLDGGVRSKTESRQMALVCSRVYVACSKTSENLVAAVGARLIYRQVGENLERVPSHETVVLVTS